MAGNIERLLGHADLVVSDATGIDDTLDRLRREIPPRPGLRYLTPPSVAPGWVAHCNHLLESARTPHFMWLPHDDEIGADWISRSEETLARNHSAILATGSIVALDRPDDAPYPARIDLSDLRLSSADLLERVRAGLEIAVHGDVTPLGLVFRSVFRRERACLLPSDDPGGAWADIRWALCMLVRGPFAAVPDIEYGKRWHPGNTHASWPGLRSDANFRTRWLPASLSELPQATAGAVLGEAWNREVETLTAMVEGATAQLRTIESSRSWRLTAPARAASGLVRRLRRRHGPAAPS